MAAERVPLSEEDRAILELEGPTVAGHTCKLIRIGKAPAAPELERLRERVSARIDEEPILRRRLDLSAGEPAWVPEPELAVERHVAAVQGGPVAAADLDGLVAELFERRLDRDAPLWRIDVASIEGGGAALVCRLHHALADGTTGMRVLRSLLWDRVEPGAGGQSSPTAGSMPQRPPTAEHQAAEDDRRRRGHLAGFLRREFAETIERSPFDGEVGARRTIAFASVPFAPLHDAAKRICGATVNDAVLAVAGGALREWVETHHGALGTVRFRVPVSLHSEADDAGNRDSFFTLPVHLEEPDPVARLRGIHAEAAERKADHDAERLERLLSSLESHHGRPLASLAKRLEASPRSFALCVSDVPGPREHRRVLGAPVDALYSVAEVGRRHGLRLAVVSYAGRLDFGLCADPAIADDLEAMARGIEAQAEAISAAG